MRCKVGQLVATPDTDLERPRPCLQTPDVTARSGAALKSDYPVAADTVVYLLRRHAKAARGLMRNCVLSEEYLLFYTHVECCLALLPKDTHWLCEALDLKKQLVGMEDAYGKPV